MITVRIPRDSNFNYQECKKLYEKHQRLINDPASFDEIITREGYYFFSFFDEDEHLGCIYYYPRRFETKDGYFKEKLFMNGFANRYHHDKNLECLKKSLDWFKVDIYSETPYKTANLCLYKCGFKKVGHNLYKYERRVK